MHKGYLVLELTCHLPYVKHIEEKKYPEENWLNNAVADTYLPLLRALKRLDSENVPINLTIVVSPTLAAMLSDELLQSRLEKFLSERIALGEKEVERTAFSPDLRRNAEMYLERFRTDFSDFTGLYGRNVLNGFRDLERKKKINIITTCASHCYMPLYASCPEMLEAQIYTAINSHNRIFNKDTKGFWLPELGYYPGIEKILRKYRIEYFFTAIHSFLFGSRLPHNGIYAPVNVDDSGVFAFCRDLASGTYILSGEDGYPGDFSYRNFSGDISGELGYDYPGYLSYSDGSRVNSGFKYYSNSSGFGPGEGIYNRERALSVVEKHADNFIYNIRKRVKSLLRYTDRPPVIVCPMDASVLGHWWFEGTDWLECLIRKLASDDELSLIYPSEYLYTYKNLESVSLSYSSVGNGGYSGDWLNGSNDWIYTHIYSIIDKMKELVVRFPDESGLRQRALNQAAREVLLSQASDWPFIMRSGIAAPYAGMRFREHISNFLKVYNDLSGNTVDTEWLTGVEKKTGIFKDIDYRIFR